MKSCWIVKTVIGPNDTDLNHNSMDETKRQKIPATSASSVTAMQEDQVLFADLDAADFDADPQHSVGCDKLAGKKHAAGKTTAKKSTAKGLPAKSKSGRGRATTRGKKEQVGIESSRPQYTRKSKDGAKTQMKLQFTSEMTPRTSDFQDLFEDDVYAFGESSSPEQKTAASHSRQKKKMPATAAVGVPPLAQRVLHMMRHGQMHSQYPSSFAASAPYQSSSGQSSQLFDAMLEKDHKAISGTEPRSSTMEQKHESVPRYYVECCYLHTSILAVTFPLNLDPHQLDFFPFFLCYLLYHYITVGVGARN